METVRGRDFEHSQMHRRILMPGEADVPNLPRLFRIHQGFERPAGGEEAVGILHPDVLVILNQVNVIRLQSPQRFIDLPAGGPVFARLLGDVARGADTPVGDASYCRRGRDCAPTTGARVAGVANGTVVQVVQAGERQATRWAHPYPVIVLVSFRSLMVFPAFVLALRRFAATQSFMFLATKSQFASFQKASTYLGRALRQSM